MLKCAPTSILTARSRSSHNALHSPSDMNTKLSIGALTAQESGEDKSVPSWLNAKPPIKSSYTTSKPLVEEEHSFTEKGMHLYLLGDY